MTVRGRRKVTVRGRRKVTVRGRRKVTVRGRRKMTVIPQERAKRAPVGIYSALRRPLATHYAK